MSTKQRLAIVVVVGTLLAACSSTNRIEPRPATTTTPAAPSTVINGAADLGVPFVADNGALTARRGSPPRGVSAEQAEHEMHTVLGLSVQTPPTQPPGDHPLAASVSLVAGLGVPPLRNRAAWIVPFVYTVFPSCPALGTPRTLPPWASNLQVVLVTSGDPNSSVIYLGAGAGLCAPRGTPTASKADS